MSFIPADILAAHDGKRRLIYAADQMLSGQPHAIIRATYTWAPGPDWLALQERWPSEEVDVMVDMTTNSRLMANVAA